MTPRKMTSVAYRRAKLERTSVEAASAIEAERAARLAKTTKLREARMAAAKGKKQSRGKAL